MEYFKNTDEITLKKMYYKCKQNKYEYGKKLFSQGENCEEIFIVVYGLIDIVLRDGNGNS